MAHPQRHAEPTRVAVIGTGLAGLTTAYLLNNDPRQRYSVTLFEQAQGLSFDAASVAVRDDTTGLTERIDLPMRATAGGYYANLNLMYHHLAIPLHPIRFLFVFARFLAATSQQHHPSDRVGSAPGTYFIHASNLHQTPPWPGTRALIPHVLETLYLILCHFWFSAACFLLPPRTSPRAESLAQYLDRLYLPRRYVSHYLLPLMSSVSTCSHDDLLAFPASDVATYKRLSHGQQHYAVCGGVSQVQRRLAQGLEDIRLGARVLEVRPCESRVLVRWTCASSPDGTEETFDRVVLAVSPDVAGRIFKPLAHTLGKIPTLQVESSVHGPDDTHSMHNFRVVGPEGETSCMHHGHDSRAQAITFRTSFGAAARTEALHAMPSGVVVKTCPLEGGEGPPALQKAVFTRTLRTVESRALVEGIMGRAPDGEAPAWVNGEDGVWLAGAWCWDGMVLLEGCVVSAMRIADDFGVQVPWRGA